VKTGYTYEFTDAALGKKGVFDSRRGIANISYQGSIAYGEPGDLPSDALEHVKSAINREMKRVHGESVPSFEAYNNNLSLNNLIFYVRSPYICPVLYNGIINQSRRNPFCPLQHNELLVKNDCREPIQQMLLQSKIPNVKSLRRFAFTDASGFPLLASISRSFRNIDIIRSLYAAYIDCRDDEYGTYIDFSANIFRTMLRHKGEKNIASMILLHKKRDTNNNAYRTLCDMIKCYDILRHCDFDFSKRYNIDELHLYLAAAVSEQDVQNRKIDYADDELDLEMSDGKFSLMLAPDTDELKGVGEEMEICVGSYANEAVSRASTILILRRLEDYCVVGCIELRNANVVQAKGPRNELLRKQEREFVWKWIRDRGLTVCTNDLHFNVAP
jgi:hypothetical protein